MCTWILTYLPLELLSENSIAQYSHCVCAYDLASNELFHLNNNLTHKID